MSLQSKYEAVVFAAISKDSRFFFYAHSCRAPPAVIRKLVERIFRSEEFMYFDPTEFGGRVKEARNRKGFTQHQFAEELDISYDHIRKIEHGERTCSMDLLVKISALLETSTDHLLTGVQQTADGRKHMDTRSLSVRDQLQKVIKELEHIAKDI